MSNSEPTERAGGVREALEPCPFCGGIAAMTAMDDRDERREWFRTISCNNCDATVEGVMGWSTFRKTPDEQASQELANIAAAKWNRRAALSPPAAPAEGAVKVKALEWYPDPGAFPYKTWGAQSSFGRFLIEEVSASDTPAYEARYTPHHLIAIKDSLDEAKAAAQADYEARIRSALAAAPAPAVDSGAVAERETLRQWLYDFDRRNGYPECSKAADLLAHPPAAEARIAELTERAEKVERERDAYKQACQTAGVCMSCVVLPPDTYGCTDCLNTGWNAGSPPSSPEDIKTLFSGMTADFGRMKADLTRKLEAAAAALGVTIKAWEALPGDRHYGMRIVQDWLVDRMKPAMDAAREAHAALLGKEKV